MGTTDYCFSFFRKPIQNIEPIRAVGIVDVYRYITGHYAQPQTEALRLMELLLKPKGTKPPILTIVPFLDYSVSGMRGN